MDSLLCASSVLVPLSSCCQSWESRGSALLDGTSAVMTWSSLRICEYIIDNNVDERAVSDELLRTDLKRGCEIVEWCDFW